MRFQNEVSSSIVLSLRFGGVVQYLGITGESNYRMKLNAKMSEMLEGANIPKAFSGLLSMDTSMPLSFTVVDGCVLLKDEYEKAKHVRLESFQDRTGFECFVNHRHFPYSGTRESLLSCLKHAVTLQRALAHEANDRRFLVILSVGDGCTVRFHEVRPGENWAAENLEGYAGEAVLLLPVGGTEDTK